METEESKYRIMVVDDNQSSLEFTSEMLEDDYEVTTCLSGQEALEKIHAFDPHIVLLDIMMPGIDGYETCRQIRSFEKFSKTKILFLSAKSSLTDRLKGYDVKGDDYLIKPFQNEELLAKLMVYIRLIREEDRRKKAEENLRRHKEELEHLIAERTNDLVISNKHLLREINEKKEAEDRLQKSEEKYRNILESIEEGYYELNNRGDLTFFNSSLANIFEYTKPMLEGQSFGNLVDKLDVEKLESLLEEVKKTGQPSPVIQWKVPFSRGVSKYLESSISPIIEADQYSGFRGIIRDITEKQIHEKSLQGLFKHAVGTLARAAEVFDQDTGEHTIRIGNYSELLAKLVEMNRQYMKDIQISAQLHDVGKIHITSAMLNKNGRLTEEEFEAIKNHTLYGSIIIGKNPDFKMANEIAMFHHEKWNGSGYPDGLKGRAIPLAARITAIVDVFDALISKRAYKKAFSYENARQIMIEGDSRLNPVESFDPNLLKIFLDHYDEFVQIHSDSLQLEQEYNRKRLNVFILEDDELLQEMIIEHFNETLSYVDIEGANSMKAMREFLGDNKDYRPQLCFIDVNLPDGSGHDAAAEMKERFPDAHLICITGDEDIDIQKVNLYGHRVFRKNATNTDAFLRNLIKTAEIIREHFTTSISFGSV